jgi:hypothetical protein
MSSLRITGADGQLGSFAIVPENRRSLRWVVDPEARMITQGDGEVEAVVTGTAEDLVLILAGDENIGVLLRSRRVRYLVADEDEATRRDTPQRADETGCFA